MIAKRAVKISLVLLLSLVTLVSLLAVLYVYISLHPDVRNWRQTFPLYGDLSEKNKKIFLDQDFKIYDRVEDLPPQFSSGKGFRKPTKENMADPGKPFQIGCIGDGKRPEARLILAGVSGPYYFIYVETCGIGYNCQLNFYKNEGQKVEYLGRLNTVKRLWSVEKIKKAIVTGHY